MQILAAPYILTPTQVLRDMQIAFEDRIVEIGPGLHRKYPDAQIHHYDNAAILPGFTNPHLHLEFSANRATLRYGDFLEWLTSVIRYREELIPRCDQECLQKIVDTIITSGTTTIGAISSYGSDLEVCVRTPLNVAYFSEIIGSNPAAADVLYADFLERYYQAKKYESERFASYVAVHSPYSVHYLLAKKAIEVAKKEGALVSVHFMESLAERQWLDSDTGPFRSFFEEFLGQTKAANRPLEFLALFQELKTLFVHAVWANEQELTMMQKGTIIHCPISNRLLGNGVLDLEKLERLGLSYTLATDGLSSNYSLNMFEELRAALFLHPHKKIVPFAKALIIATTTFARTLGFASGTLEPGFMADMQVVPLPQDLRLDDEIYLHIILHTQKPLAVYLKGVQYG